MRSGRRRSAARIKSIRETSPLPSGPGARASSRSRLGEFCRFNSAVSSMVRIRSLGGMAPERALRKVVLPLPVPPLMKMFSFWRTAFSRKTRASGLRLCRRTSSSRLGVKPVKRLRLSAGPSGLAGGSTACRRDPSGKRRLAMGRSSLITRLPWPKQRRMTLKR